MIPFMNKLLLIRKIKKTSLIISELCTVFFIAFNSIEQRAPNVSIWTEAESAENIEFPFEPFGDENASAGAAIQYSGSSHSIDHYIVYDIEIVEDGDYIFWGRCLWEHQCGNSFLLQIDNSRRYKFGQDPVHDIWHWVKGPVFHLKKGQHKLALWSEEVEAKLDKFLLTTEKTLSPSGFGEQANRQIIFNDGLVSDLKLLNKNAWTIISLRENISFIDSVFDKDSVLSFETLIAKLQQKDKLFSKEMLQRFHPQVRHAIDEYDGEDFVSENLKQDIIAQINKIITGSLLFRPELANELPDIANSLISIASSKKLTQAQLNRWLIENAFHDCFNTSLEKSYLYLKPAPNHFECFVSDFTTPRDYVLKENIQCGREVQVHDVHVLFCYRDKYNYYDVIMTDKKLTLTKKIDGVGKTIAESSILGQCSLKKPLTVSVTRIFPTIEIKLNGLIAISAKDSSLVGGSFGGGSTSGDIHFKKIEYFTDFEPNYFNNFFGHQWDYMQQWEYVSGFWRVSYGGIRALLGGNIKSQNALLCFGQDYWRQYAFQAAIRAEWQHGAGICFLVQDAHNYFILRWWNETFSQEPKLQLAKMQNDSVQILKSVPCSFENGSWYKMRVVCNKENIQAYIDDTLIFEQQGNFDQSGRVGLWVDSEKQVCFDDISVKKVTSANDRRQDEKVYNFQVRTMAALDLCDWLISSKTMVGPPLSQRPRGVVFKKEMFEDIYMMHKKSFAPLFDLNFSLNSQLTDEVILQFILFFSHEKRTTRYDISFKNSTLFVFKNGKKCNGKKVLPQWQNLNILIHKNEWQIVTNGRRIARFNEELNIESIRFGFGFGGVGKQDININEIKIKASSFTCQIDQANPNL